MNHENKSKKEPLTTEERRKAASFLNDIATRYLTERGDLKELNIEQPTMLSSARVPIEIGKLTVLNGVDPETFGDFTRWVQDTPSEWKIHEITPTAANPDDVLTTQEIHRHPQRQGTVPMSDADISRLSGYAQGMQEELHSGQ